MSGLTAYEKKGAAAAQYKKTASEYCGGKVLDGGGVGTGQDGCQSLCDGEKSCVAYAVMKVKETGKDNCVLYSTCPKHLKHSHHSGDLYEKVVASRQYVSKKGFADCPQMADKYDDAANADNPGFFIMFEDDIILHYSSIRNIRMGLRISPRPHNACACIATI